MLLKNVYVILLVSILVGSVTTVVWSDCDDSSIESRLKQIAYQIDKKT